MKPETRHDRLTLHPFSAGEGIPTEAECRDLWLRFGVPDEVTVHSRMVAELARIFVIYLRHAGLKVILFSFSFHKISIWFFHRWRKYRKDHERIFARIPGRVDLIHRVKVNRAWFHIGPLIIYKHLS